MPPITSGFSDNLSPLRSRARHRSSARAIAGLMLTFGAEQALFDGVQAPVA
jgi:hypothetical protein